MGKIDPSQNPNPIHHSPERKKKEDTKTGFIFFNPHIKAKSLQGRASAANADAPDMTALFKKAKPS